eukprot:6136545-Pleurochrysis_carterae.AAC.1
MFSGMFLVFNSSRNFAPSLAHARCHARSPTVEWRPRTAAAPRLARRPNRATRATRQLASTSVFKTLR